MDRDGLLVDLALGRVHPKVDDSDHVRPTAEDLADQVQRDVLAPGQAVEDEFGQAFLAAAEDHPGPRRRAVALAASQDLKELLPRQGHVSAKWSESENGRRRKYYRITKEGRSELAAQRQQWKAVDGTLRGIWMQACTV